jgi:hypothetical protein
MKNNVIKFLTLVVLIAGPVIYSFGQPYPPLPNNGNDPSGGTLHCNVPVGNGYWILLALAFGYGVYKIWQMRKAEKTI